MSFPYLPTPPRPEPKGDPGPRYVPSGEVLRDVARLQGPTDLPPETYLEAYHRSTPEEQSVLRALCAALINFDDRAER